jgi:capsule biosynthesis phosphatase|tara:strand:+ start:160 stop:537 length:378 start_codon:yes stop_codon:yes gene_type:complete
MKIKSIKIFAFDIDNTICTTKSNNYKKSVPKNKVVKIINELKSQGHIIKIFTSRYMGRNKDNFNLVKKKYYNSVAKQLKSWDVQYDELILGKPSYDYIIDDKALNIKDKLTLLRLKKILSINKNK